MDSNYVLIIAGGAGTRLWPLSRKQRPKQFQSFTNHQSLLQGMVKLASQSVPLEHIFILVTPEFRGLVLEQLPNLPTENLLSDPMRKDTGPAYLLGMLQIEQRDPKAVVAVLWSDHLIQQPKIFGRTLSVAFKASREYPESLITVGAKPTHPDTGLGYIQMDKEVKSFDEVPLFRAKRFIEKPDLTTAKTFVSSWEYLWNTGYSIMAAAAFHRAFLKVQPELKKEVESLEKALPSTNPEDITQAYAAFPKLSIDYLFTQKLTDLMVIPADMGWSDIGNWNTLHDVLKENKEGNLYSRGEVTLTESENCLVFAKEKPIIGLGLKDLIVVDEGDVILVMTKDKAQAVKEVVNNLQNSKPELL